MESHKLGALLDGAFEPIKSVQVNVNCVALNVVPDAQIRGFEICSASCGQALKLGLTALLNHVAGSMPSEIALCLQKSERS